MHPDPTTKRQKRVALFYGVLAGVLAHAAGFTPVLAALAAVAVYGVLGTFVRWAALHDAIEDRRALERRGGGEAE